MQENKNINYWLKPIGTAIDNTKLKKLKVNELNKYVECCFKMSECQFKRSTETINKGDILICYLSGLRQVIYISEVTENGSSVMYPIEERKNNYAKGRWPYHVKVRDFEKSGVLLNKNIYLNDLKINYFENINADGFISYKNDKDFKRVRQQDRLQLDHDFAKFVLKESKK